MFEPKAEFMQEAIAYARRAGEAGDYAIGAVLANPEEGRIVVAASNRTKLDQDPAGHAELLVIKEGARLRKNRHLEDLVLYSTHEPCPMCSSVAVWARLHGIVYGASMNDMENFRVGNGNNEYLWRTINIPCREVVRQASTHTRIYIVESFLREACLGLFHSEKLSR